MIRNVVVVEPQLDELARVAELLRSRGFRVNLVDGHDLELIRGRAVRAEAILLSDAVPDVRALAAQLRAALGGSVSVMILSDDPVVDGDLPRHDAAGIAAALGAHRGTSIPPTADSSHFAGDLEQMPVPDLLQVLGANRRSGVLVVESGAGSAEVHLAEGEVIDAAQGEHVGEKAFFRVLGTRAGRFVFTERSSVARRRIERPTRGLLLDGLRRLDEADHRRTKLGTGHLAARGVRGDEVGLRALLLERAQSPVSLAELLDAAPDIDPDIIDALVQLVDAGRLEQVDAPDSSQQLVPAAREGVYRSLLARLRRPGFSGPARLVLLVEPRQVAELSLVVSRLRELSQGAQPPITPGGARILGELTIAGGRLELAMLPYDDRVAPWAPLVLGGAAGLVVLTDGVPPWLEETCHGLGVVRLRAGSARDGHDPTDPRVLRRVLRVSLDELEHS